jgi:hypothetical protein
VTNAKPPALSAASPKERPAMAKLSLTRLWMMSYPNDTPPPRSPAAAAWRRKRFQSPRHEAERAKYEAALAEMKRQENELGNVA